MNFRGDEASAHMLTNFVDGANVGMIQGGSSRKRSAPGHPLQPASHFIFLCRFNIRVPEKQLSGNRTSQELMNVREDWPNAELPRFLLEREGHAAHPV